MSDLNATAAPPASRDWSHLSMTLIFGLLILYTVAWAMWRPPGIGIRDETAYVSQAVAFAQGDATVHRVDALTGAERVHAAASKPPGVALMMAPFVRLFGVSGAFILGVLSLWLAVLSTARLLRAKGHDPLWATVVMAYLPILVLSRTAMSDVFATAWAALSLLAFFCWRSRSRSWAVLAGFIIGANLVFRETNIFIMLPLCVGALVRRDRHLAYLILGGILGCVLRLVLFGLVFGSIWGFQKEGLIYGYSLNNVVHNLPLYLFALVVMVPFGLLSVPFYGGPRRREVQLTAILFLGFYSLYGYSGAESGGLQRLVVSPRFLAPMVPLLALTMADALPRLWARSGWATCCGWLVAWLRRGWVVGLSVAVVAIHPVHYGWTMKRAGISNLIQDVVPQEACLVLSSGLEKKFVQELYGPRKWVPAIKADAVLQMLPMMKPRCEETYLLILNRTDSSYWSKIAKRNDRMLEILDERCSLEAVVQHESTRSLQLKIWKIGVCAAP